MADYLKGLEVPSRDSFKSVDGYVTILEDRFLKAFDKKKLESDVLYGLALKLGEEMVKELKKVEGVVIEYIPYLDIETRVAGEPVLNIKGISVDISNAKSIQEAKDIMERYEQTFKEKYDDLDKRIKDITEAEVHLGRAILALSEITPLIEENLNHPKAYFYILREQDYNNEAYDVHIKRGVYEAHANLDTKKMKQPKKIENLDPINFSEEPFLKEFATNSGDLGVNVYLVKNPSKMAVPYDLLIFAMAHVIGERYKHQQMQDKTRSPAQRLVERIKQAVNR